MMSLSRALCPRRLLRTNNLKRFSKGYDQSKAGQTFAQILGVILLMEREINITVDHEDIFSTAQVFVTTGTIFEEGSGALFLTAPSQSRRCWSSWALIQRPAR